MQNASIWLIQYMCEYVKGPRLNFLSADRHMANGSLAGRILPWGGIFISLSSRVILTPLPNQPSRFYSVWRCAKSNPPSSAQWWLAIIPSSSSHYPGDSRAHVISPPGQKINTDQLNNACLAIVVNYNTLISYEKTNLPVERYVNIMVTLQKWGTGKKTDKKLAKVMWIIPKEMLWD